MTETVALPQLPELSVSMDVPLQDISTGKPAMNLSLMNLSKKVSDDLRQNLTLNNRGTVTVDAKASMLNVSTNPPNPIHSTLLVLDNTLRMTLQSATQRNLAMSPTADANALGDTSKTTITLYAENKELAEKQLQILNMITPDANAVLANRHELSHATDKAMTVENKDGGLVTTIKIDTTPHASETVALLHTIVANKDACELSEQVIQNTPANVNKLSALYDANIRTLDTLLSDDKMDNLAKIVSGRRQELAPALTPYAA